MNIYQVKINNPNSAQIHVAETDSYKKNDHIAALVTVLRVDPSIRAGILSANPPSYTATVSENRPSSCCSAGSSIVLNYNATELRNIAHRHQ